MRVINLATVCVMLLVSLSVRAQYTSLPKTTINGNEYYYYQTNTGESIYDIARKLGVTKDDIVRYNPDAANGIDNGTTLYFPAGEAQQAKSTTSNRLHTVEQGETLYGLAKRYNITIDQLIAANPGTENGVSVGQVLYLPVDPSSVATTKEDQVRNAFEKTSAQQPVQVTTQPIAPTSSDPVYHTLQYGESIYSLAKQYNASIEGILAANPGLEPAEYVQGEQVKVFPNSAQPFQYERSGRRYYKYKVQKGETFASIAADNGITEQELRDANPGMNKAKKGKTISLPRPYSEQLMGDMQTISLTDLQNYYEPRINDIYAQINRSGHDGVVNIAMVLPFQLHKSAPPKQAYLYTDFYKGFLLALDSARTITDKRINLKVYDTQHNLNVTDSILALPELKSMDMIIAPSEPKQLQRINRFGLENNVAVLNCFTTKNEDYRDNANVYQVNTPTDKLASNVLRWFDQQFSGYNVIYLVETGGEGDKEIFDDFRSHIAANNQFSTSLNVSGELSYNTVSNKMNPGSKYVFIPSSGSKTLLKNFVKALKQIKRERFDCDIALIGYPEYVLYLKDYQTDLQDIDTYMFSRFFNSKGFRTRDIEARYKQYFGGEMLSAVPNMGLYGFDTGMYLLHSLGTGDRISDKTPLYKGIQTSFRFERDNNWSGYTNQAIEIVHFSTDHKITVEVK